jgi:uncharacterized protein (TIRG00374 family)
MAASSRLSGFTRGRGWGLLLTALIYAASVFAAYRLIDDASMRKALSLPLSLLCGMLALSLLNYLVRTWRWVALCAHLRIEIPPIRNSYYYLAGYALTATPGKAGEAIRLWWMRSAHEVPYLRSFPVMIADRAIDAWALLLLAVLSSSAFAAYLWQSVLLAAIVIAVSLPLVFPQLLEPPIRVAFRLMPAKRRLWVRARQLARSLRELAHPRTYGVTLIPTMLGWVAECYALYLLLQYFGAEVELTTAVFVFCFSMLVGAVSMLPGGLGSTEATMVLLLKAMGVDLGTAVAATAIIRMTTFWFAIVVGLAFTPAALRSARTAEAT